MGKIKVSNFDKETCNKITQDVSERYKQLIKEADERIAQEKRRQSQDLTHIDEYVANYSDTLDFLNEILQ